MSLNLGELLDFLVSTSLNDAQVGLQKIGALVLLIAPIEITPTLIHLRQVIIGIVLLMLLELHLDELLAQGLAVGVNAVNKHV